MNTGTVKINAIVTELIQTLGKIMDDCILSGFTLGTKPGYTVVGLKWIVTHMPAMDIEFWNIGGHTLMDQIGIDLHPTGMCAIDQAPELAGV
mgnify:CR=1 FL=1